MKNVQALVLFCFFVALVGCASQPSTYDQVKAQMDKAESDRQAKLKQESDAIDVVMSPFYQDYNGKFVL
jgi:uncharacterized lipoprotein